MTAWIPACRRHTVVAGFALAAGMTAALLAPEIGADDFRISDMGPDGEIWASAFSADVAYNGINAEYLVVWGGHNHVGFHEIFVQRIDASTGEELGVNDRQISEMGAAGLIGIRPAVAYNPVENEYLVVWQSDDEPPGSSQIWAQRLEGATGAEIGVEYQISGMDWADDAAVACSPITNEYLVVWVGRPAPGGEFEIHAQRLDGATGSEVGGDDYRISDMGPDGDTAYWATDPAVAYATTLNQYLVVWSGDDVVDGEFEIYCQLINATTGDEVGNGDRQVSSVGPIGHPDFDAVDPAVAYNAVHDEYLVVWCGNRQSGGFPVPTLEIQAQRLAPIGPELVGDDLVISDLGPNDDFPGAAEKPAVACNATTGQYLVAWQERPAREIFVQLIEGQGGRVGENHAVSDMGPPGSVDFAATEPAVACNGVSRYLVVWSGDDDTPPLVDNEYEIFGQIWAGDCAEAGDCTFLEYCRKEIGDCDGPGECLPRPESCFPLSDPVCGCDGVTYINACEAARAGTSVAAEGPCPQICSFNEYCLPWQYCQKEPGDCEGLGNCVSIPEFCPIIEQPVCGCDGMTYLNSCYASFVGVNVEFLEPCDSATPYDTNLDGVTDVDDLVNVILAWDTHGLHTPGIDADVDNSGLVDVDDLIAVILGWGPPA